uniref:Uncharacterized protein n=1 Tax=Rhizophagus irregularis (strain DAOM 181602 / DAOM 197198 / MUCL 43194) TaxID=747089 RepID=U9SSP1_RHIID
MVENSNPPEVSTDTNSNRLRAVQHFTIITSNANEHSFELKASVSLPYEN